MQAFDDISQAALDLSKSDRAKLAQRLIISLDESLIDGPLGASDEEVRERLDAVASGHYDAVDWREALARIRATIATAQS